MHSSVGKNPCCSSAFWILSCKHTLTAPHAMEWCCSNFWPHELNEWYGLVCSQIVQVTLVCRLDPVWGCQIPCAVPALLVGSTQGSASQVSLAHLLDLVPVQAHAPDQACMQVYSIWLTGTETVAAFISVALEAMTINPATVLQPQKSQD